MNNFNSQNLIKYYRIYQLLGIEDFWKESTLQIKKNIDTEPINTILNIEEIHSNEITNFTNIRKIIKNVKYLEELKNIILNYDGCDIKKTAKNTVFSDGIPNAKVMLIGEAPGAKEDEIGVPFCGESGKLLDIMFNTIGLYRQKNMYITNSVFWRPPGNRTPTKEEVNLCRPFTEKHIAIIKPELLILVGGIATTTFLGDSFQISKIRRQIYMYDNEYLEKPIKTTAVFHPAYLLRQPQKKKEMWHDLLYIKQNISLNT